MSDVEYASAVRGVSSAYQGLAKWAGVELREVIEAAEKDQLGAIIERRQFVRPTSGERALREIHEKRYGPGDKQPSPHERIGELRAMRAIWTIEERELCRRPLNPLECLTEIYGRRVPPWWGLV